MGTGKVADTFSGGIFHECVDIPKRIFREIFLILLFLKTLLFRWYVFSFLFLGFWFLIRQVGALGAIARFSLSFLLSYFCEWSSSLPMGWFPFGHYTYLPTTLDREIWVGHLPFMDFLSFSFLMVASLGVIVRVWGLSIGEALSRPVRLIWPIFFLADLLFFGIDMVIDPVALRGNRWFLGQIYYYPEGGSYFGVPFANFLGWAVLGCLILFSWRILSIVIPIQKVQIQKSDHWLKVDRWGPTFLWFSVYLFNLGIALYLRELFLFLSDLIVFVVLACIVFFVKKVFWRPLHSPSSNP